MQQLLLASWKDSYEYYSKKGSLRAGSSHYFFNEILYEHLKNLMRLSIKPNKEDMDKNIFFFMESAQAKSASKARGIGFDDFDLQFMFDKLDEIIISGALYFPSKLPESKGTPESCYRVQYSAVLNNLSFTKKEIEMFQEVFSARNYEMAEGLIFFVMSIRVTEPPSKKLSDKLEKICLQKTKEVFTDYAMKKGFDTGFKINYLDKIKTALTLYLV